MLQLLGSPRRCCDGITRRESLQVGGLSALGGLFNLPTMLQAEQAAGKAFEGKAKSVIVLYLLGGAGTQDMWDMKPNAPADIRGEYNPVPTNVPGIDICEHMPRLTKWMHKAAIVRTVNHKAGCHNPLASYTGYEQTLSDITTTKDTYPPSMGSVCQYLTPNNNDFPSYVYMPCYLGWGTAIRYPGPYAGYLGKRYDPFFTECSPYVDNPPEEQFAPQILRGEPKIPHGVLADGVTLDRLNSRKTLIDQFDDQLRKGAGQVNFDQYQQRAWNLLTSRKVKAAFDLSTADPALIDRYGKSMFGNCSLIARRLVGEGVRFINVTWDTYWERIKAQYEGWDTHNKNFPIYKNYHLPCFDQSCTALLEDLERHGQLDETLVVVLSEMGRTPKINKNAGRDHWTFCYSMVMFGAGIKGGTVYGASDAQAAYVQSLPVSTGDICATIYHCLGIDPHHQIRDYANRPVAVAHGGEPIHDVLA